MGRSRPVERSNPAHKAESLDLQTGALEVNRLYLMGRSFAVALLRNSRGLHLSGYVRIPDAHPWYGRSDVSLPGKWRAIAPDVTYSGRLSEAEGWWIGTDHADMHRQSLVDMLLDIGRLSLLLRDVEMEG